MYMHEYFFSTQILFGGISQQWLWINTGFEESWCHLWVDDLLAMKVECLKKRANWIGKAEYFYN